MNSLNSDPNPALSQNKFKPYDIQNSFYQFLRLSNNPNISPDFGQLQNPYGPNQLLATQFSFQYSDNQGLGDGLNANSHSNVWNTGPMNAAMSTQSRPNQPQSIDPSSAHFFSIPQPGPTQATDQNLFYQTCFTPNMFWTHPHQNYSLPPAANTDKSQPWSDAIINSHQYPSLSSSINYKTTLSPIDHSNNHILSISNSQANYQKHLAQNGFHVSQIDSNGSQLPVRVMNDNPHMVHIERSSLADADNCISQDKKFSTVSTSNNLNAQIESLQSQLANDCILHKDGPSFDASRQSAHNGNNNNNGQQNYSPKSLSKHRSSPTMDRGDNADFWNPDSSRTNNSSNAKSYAKVAKQSSRSSNCSNNVGNLNSLATPYYSSNGVTANSQRSNYKSTMNGFATGNSRPSANNNNNGSHNSWFNNSSATANGNQWALTKSKWSQDNNNRNNPSNTVIESNIKSSWASKVSQTSAEESIRKAEFKMKEIQAQINPKRIDLNFDKTRYFVIKSYSEDDVHRSIKYKIWCSTKEGNKRLNEAFQNAQKIGGHVLLFFSVNGSGHFCGIAEMISCVDENVDTKVWCQDKWRGQFFVKWIFVKDVPNTQLRHISTKVKVQKPGSDSATEIKPITNLRDATELKSERAPGSSYKDDAGYQALRIIMDCKSSMSIFDDFLHYEKRELGIES